MTSPASAPGFRPIPASDPADKMPLAASSDRRRNRLLLSLFTLAAACTLLLLLELALRSFGVGVPGTFFLRDTENGAAIYRDHPAATQSYFGPELARAPAPFSFPAEKEPGTFRIFVLGGSAAAGDPEPAYSFSRLLHFSLSAASPQQSVEVINASITAVNSHVLRRMMKEIRDLEPDLVILYLGHNEVVGPYGPASLFGRFTPSRLDIALRTAIRSSRVGQLWSHFLHRAGMGTAAPEAWQGMRMFLDRQLTADDPRLEPTYRHFRGNLRAMLREARRASAHVILCTVASDLRDCPPFASLAAPPLTEPDAARLRAVLDEGTLASLAEARTLAPSYAEAHYRWALLVEADAPDQAADAYRLARDQDTLRFRADSRINALIREVAGEAAAEHVTLLDIEQAADRHPADSWPSLFLDHVHFTYEGNRWMAAQLHDTLQARWPDLFPGAPPPPEALAEAAAWNAWAEWRIALEMSRRHAKPPFTFQWNHAERAAQWADWVARSAESTGSEVDEIDRAFQRALSGRPHDWFLLHAYAEFLVDRGHFVQAVTPFEQAYRRAPHRPESRERLAFALAGAERMEEALALFRSDTDATTAARLGRIGVELGERGTTAQAVATLRKACEIAPDNGFLRAALGGSLLIAGNDIEAESALREALRIDPTLADAHNNLGSALARQARIDEAIPHFRDALAASPGHAPARRNLLNALHQAALTALQQQREERAVSHLREALEADPFHPPAMLDLAMLHATSRDPAVHSPSEALLWAKRALQAEAPPQPRVLVAYAAALAAAGRHEEAQATAQQALALLPPAERPPWESRIRTILDGLMEP